MTLISRIAMTSLLALLLSTGAIGAEGKKTLYERLGGKAALTAVVNELWAVVSADPRINARFAHTNPEAFGGQLVDFLCQASGGPCKYQGKDMKTAHTGMNLSEADFNALAEDTVKALDKFHVPAGEKNEVIALLASQKGDVINH
jgi:hemoglobin